MSATDPTYIGYMTVSCSVHCRPCTCGPSDNVFTASTEGINSGHSEYLEGFGPDELKRLPPRELRFPAAVRAPASVAQLYVSPQLSPRWREYHCRR